MYTSKDNMSHTESTHNNPDQAYDSPDDEPSEPWMYQMNPDQYKPLFQLVNGKRICDRKIKGRNEKYYACKREVIQCDYCHNFLCTSLECIPSYAVRLYGGVWPCKKHGTCLECDRITCRMSGICKECEKAHLFDWITDNVAIGSYQAPYEPFDVVINLDFPDNRVKQGVVEYHFQNTSHVIRCGFSDDEEGMNMDNLIYLVNLVDELERVYTKEKPLQILFHCYAGVSRSTTVAIAYLSKRLCKRTGEIYELVKQRRPRIDPNPAFRRLLGLL